MPPEAQPTTRRTGADSTSNDHDVNRDSKSLGTAADDAECHPSARSVRALGGLNSGSLTAILGQLTPTQITSLLSDGASPTSLITGLEGVLGGLGGAPSAASVDALLAQLNGLMAGGLPTNATQLAQLSTLLGGVTPLLSTSGLNASVLTTLLDTTQSALAGALLGALPPESWNRRRDLLPIRPD